MDSRSCELVVEGVWDRTFVVVRARPARDIATQEKERRVGKVMSRP